MPAKFPQSKGMVHISEWNVDRALRLRNGGAKRPERSLQPSAIERFTEATPLECPRS
jgi:hypothetical protein